MLLTVSSISSLFICTDRRRSRLLRRLPFRSSLDFCESAAGEWRREGFELLRSALPGALGREPGFFLEVTHDCEGVTHWRFGSVREKLIDDRPMLEWLRRRMPVFWMAEGMLSGKRVDPGSAQSPDETELAAEVTRHYRQLLEGTALDIPTR